jgi:hypothetical protein
LQDEEFIELKKGLDTQTWSATETVQNLHSTFAILGFPRSITCDNGQPFSSAEFYDFCERFAIKIFHTPPFWPQANGLVEKQNSGIKKRLQISKAMDSKSWQDDLLLDYLVMYRSTPQDTTGKSPFELMFGRKMKDKIPQFLSPVSGKLDEEARAQDQKQKEKGREVADRKRRAREPSIEEGDRVVMRNIPGIKLTPNFGSEVYTVKKRDHGDCIIASESEGVERRRNVTALKKIHMPAPAEPIHPPILSTPQQPATPPPEDQRQPRRSHRVPTYKRGRVSEQM